MATSQSLPTDWNNFYGPTAATEPTAVSTGTSQSGPAHGIEGRVGKSGRRRTRASRRAPTTLLNTDPTNFRAMVQQFTGAPSGPYPNRSGPVINFGYGSGMGQAPVVATGTGPLGHYQQQQQQQQQNHSQGQVYVNRDGDGGVFSQGGIGNNGFLQGFNFDANDGARGVFLDAGQVVMRGDPANDRNGGYFF